MPILPQKLQLKWEEYRFSMKLKEDTNNSSGENIDELQELGMVHVHCNCKDQ